MKAFGVKLMEVNNIEFESTGKTWTDKDRIAKAKSTMIHEGNQRVTELVTKYGKIFYGE